MNKFAVRLGIVGLVAGLTLPLGIPSQSGDPAGAVVAAEPVTAATAANLSTALLGADEGYGNLTGQFVLDGAVPVLPPKVKKGDTTVRDPAVCSAEEVPDESIVVDPTTKGIANVFVYEKKATKIHPDLKTSKVKEVVFDQKGCRFVPHALFARTDQTVLVMSDDSISHNTHTYTSANNQINQSVTPKNRKGDPYKKTRPESLPRPVKCDIHPWMTANWLILDHPYAAISGPDGKFTIENLPAGTHELIVWQESSGYIERKLKVDIKAGQTTDLGAIKVPVAKLTGK